MADVTLSLLDSIDITPVMSSIPDKMWDLSNYITGFAVAQAIATAFAVAKNDFESSLKERRDFIGGLASVVVFGLFYLIGVIWCRTVVTNLVEEDDIMIWNWATVGRIFAIVLFSAVAFLAFLGRYEEWKTSEKMRQLPVTDVEQRT